MDSINHAIFKEHNKNNEFQQHKEPIVNNMSDKTLVLVPHRLFSLWDMNQIVAKDFLGAWGLFAQALTFSSENRGRKASKEEAELLIKALIETHYQSGKLGLVQSVKLCNSRGLETGRP
jgi:hypothetical protein